MTTDATKPLAKFSWSLNSNTGLSSSGSQNDITPEMYGAIMGVLAGRFPEAEIARLQAQVADAKQETESLRERLFSALKTDEVLAKALQEVDHALDLRRSTLSAVMDVACVQKARADELQAQVDALRHERDHARASTDNAVKLLVSIHSLLYPAPTNLADGRTMVFRPKSPDPHEVLQELSDRIRALPDELAALAAAGR